MLIVIGHGGHGKVHCMRHDLVKGVQMNVRYLKKYRYVNVMEYGHDEEYVNVNVNNQMLSLSGTKGAETREGQRRHLGRQRRG